MYLMPLVLLTFFKQIAVSYFSLFIHYQHNFYPLTFGVSYVIRPRLHIFPIISHSQNSQSRVYFRRPRVTSAASPTRHRRMTCPWTKRPPTPCSLTTNTTWPLNHVWNHSRPSPKLMTPALSIFNAVAMPA